MSIWKKPIKIIYTIRYILAVKIVGYFVNILFKHSANRQYSYCKLFLFLLLKYRINNHVLLRHNLSATYILKDRGDAENDDGDLLFVCGPVVVLVKEEECEHSLLFCLILSSAMLRFPWQGLLRWFT